MNLLTVEEKIQCLKNLLDDPDDWISFELLRLAGDNEDEPETSDGPIGMNDSSPEVSKRSFKAK